MKNIIYFLSFMIILSSCTSQKQVKKEEPPIKKENSANTGKTSIDESFDPSKLDEEDITVKTNRSTEANKNFQDSMLSPLQNSGESDKVIEGYRVQICAVSDEMKAREIQKESILKFNEDIYLIYDSPYYKIRVGDCTTRYEADLLQKMAEEKGFIDAWVVKTKVKPRPKPE